MCMECSWLRINKWQFVVLLKSMLLKKSSNLFKMYILKIEKALTKWIQMLSCAKV